MKQHRGVFRRLAGIVVILIAVDVASTTALSTNTEVTFQQVGTKVDGQQPPPATGKRTPKYAGLLILVIGLGIGAGLYYWGDAASQKLLLEQRLCSQGHT